MKGTPLLSVNKKTLTTILQMGQRFDNDKDKTPRIVLHNVQFCNSRIFHATSSIMSLYTLEMNPDLKMCFIWPDRLY